jgi:hypothetical protein
MLLEVASILWGLHDKGQTLDTHTMQARYIAIQAGHVLLQAQGRRYKSVSMHDKTR